MSVSLSSIVSESKKLVERLRDDDDVLESLIYKWESASNTVVKRCQAEDPYNGCNAVPCVDGSELKILAYKNELLRQVLHSHQVAADVLMHEYRRKISSLLQGRADVGKTVNSLDPHPPKNIQYLAEGLQTINNACLIDEKKFCDSIQNMAQLRVENETFKHLEKSSPLRIKNKNNNTTQTD
ncbi:unnamed protein product [Dimorphilus gyrociliatus]|uniref:Uncharacterized protein n=1 Tax=Dimorphilus gyrociliatus TaxID=2664684 RepID=A0A7I8VR42_9ANNE|nr:unnamed protein product [Dimorphilus gyrociliatus]